MTSTAPPITNPRSGTHSPKDVQKADDLGGVGHARHGQPHAEYQSAEQSCQSLHLQAPQQVVGDVNGRDTRDHKGDGGSQGAHRESTDAADPVAASAAAAQFDP